MISQNILDNVLSESRRKTHIPSLVSDLAGDDPVVREKAREALVAIGKPAVPALIQLLAHGKSHVRWEAAKALCGIADPISATALVSALDDPDDDVRWVAAVGLTTLGPEGLQPLLAALLERAQSAWFRQAHTTSAMPWQPSENSARFSAPSWPRSISSSRRFRCRWRPTPHSRNCERCNYSYCSAISKSRARRPLRRRQGGKEH